MRRYLIPLLFFTLLSGPAFADPVEADQLDADQLEAFLEPVFDRHLREHNIPGATFAAVQGSELVLARGYGLANIERGEPVLPDQSLFNTGSVTKLFTATAVMQQVEANTLDLNTDVNEYLVDFHVGAPSNFKNPTLTLMDLLTHTGGFDESGSGMLAMTPESVPPL